MGGKGQTEPNIVITLDRNGRLWRSGTFPNPFNHNSTVPHNTFCFTRQETHSSSGKEVQNFGLSENRSVPWNVRKGRKGKRRGGGNKQLPHFTQLGLIVKTIPPYIRYKTRSYPARPGEKKSPNTGDVSATLRKGEMCPEICLFFPPNVFGYFLAWSAPDVP